MTAPVLPPRQLRAAFLVGVVLAVALFGTAVAWRFGFQPKLGRPYLWHLYAPWTVWGWWQEWGHEPGWRRDAFRAALTIALFIMMLPAMLVVVAHQMFGSMAAPGKEAEGTGTGDPRSLARHPGFGSDADGIVVGSTPKGDPLLDTGGAHVAVEGAPGTGKGAGHGIPTALLWSGGMLMNDPKGEGAAITGRWRRRYGPVHVFDPTRARTARFNPLLELRTDGNLHGDCEAAAQVMAHPGVAAESSYWDDAAANLITALLMHVRTSVDPTLAHLWRLTTDLDAGRPITGPMLPHVRTTLQGLAEKEQKYRGGVIATLNTRLSFLSNPRVQAATASSDFRASDLQCGKRPGTLYLVTPPLQAKALRPLRRLVLQAVLISLMHSLQTTGDGREKRHRLLLLLDEVQGMGQMDTLEDALPLSRGYGIRALLMFQDTDQLRRIYGADQALTALCSTVCVMAGFGGKSLDEAVRWGGDHFVVREGRQRRPGLGGASTSESVQRERVLNPAELIRRSDEEVLVFTRGASPTWLRKVRYYEDKRFEGMFDPEHDRSREKDADDTAALPVPTALAGESLTVELTAAQAAALAAQAGGGRAEATELVRASVLALLPPEETAAGSGYEG